MGAMKSDQLGDVDIADAVAIGQAERLVAVDICRERA